ncbi:hypothetical protein BJY04DRAFT_194602 [Aspergillus karnatakaensis]|uniref:uncharacterized protein n=1 Tax=Aspergillus karnatakaensis TaxID=1810916 RepID=UPI003CCDD3F1
MNIGSIEQVSALLASVGLGAAGLQTVTGTNHGNGRGTASLGGRSGGHGGYGAHFNDRDDWGSAETVVLPRTAGFSAKRELSR